LREFCGCWPAYTVPARPFGLKADPGAAAALPGVNGAVELPQLWFGCPVACALGAANLARSAAADVGVAVWTAARPAPTIGGRAVATGAAKQASARAVPAAIVEIRFKMCM
jgi:hypothetical protein